MPPLSAKAGKDTPPNWLLTHSVLSSSSHTPIIRARPSQYPPYTSIPPPLHPPTPSLSTPTPSLPAITDYSPVQLTALLLLTVAFLLRLVYSTSHSPDSTPLTAACLQRLPPSNATATTNLPIRPPAPIRHPTSKFVGPARGLTDYPSFPSTHPSSLPFTLVLSLLFSPTLEFTNANLLPGKNTEK